MRKYLLITALLGVLLLAGCSFGETTENKISKVLGDMYSAEEGYRDSQSELKSFEQEEQSLFDDTMALTQEETAEVAENVGKLQEIVDKRTEKVTEEETAMKNAEEHLDAFAKIEEKLEQNERELIGKLKESITKRYAAHAEFIAAYKELTNMQKKLYDSLINEETDVTTLNEQVDQVNEQNAVVVEKIESFNKATNDLNVVRDEVYDALEKES